MCFLFSFEYVPLVEFMYLYLQQCQARVTVDDSGLCVVVLVQHISSAN